MPGTDTETPPATLDGWFVLHQLFRLDWAALKGLEDGRVAEIGDDFRRWLEDSGAADGWTGAYRVIGGGVDLMLLHMRPTLEALGDAERAVGLSGLGGHLRLARDYLSVVELGLYGLTVKVAERVASRGGGEEVEQEAFDAALETALEEHRSLEYVQRRLFPRQPAEMPYVCFYPMNKRRDAGQNWYALALDVRSRLMQDHGSVGRRYAGRISQVISGSIGLDDWEWAVTLFAGDPLDFKNVVTDMRYDRASADYAEFGEFYVGKRMEGDEWTRLIDA